MEIGYNMHSTLDIPRYSSQGSPAGTNANGPGLVWYYGVVSWTFSVLRRVCLDALNLGSSGMNFAAI